MRILIGLAALLFSTLLSAQSDLSVNNDIVLEGVTDNPSLMKSIEAATQDALSQYIEKGDFLAPGKEYIDARSANDFKALFKPTAKLFQDFYEYPGDPIDIFAYKNEIYDNFEETGVIFEVEDPFLEDLRPMPEGNPRFYVVTVEFTKRIMNYANSDGEIIEAIPGEERTYALRMEIEMSIEDLSKFLIMGVDCTADCVETAADAEAYVSFTLGAGLPLASTSVGNNFTEQYEGALDFSAGPSFVAGLSVTSSYLAPKRGSEKNFFLTLGAFYRYWNLESSVTNLRTEFMTEAVDADGGMTTYNRLVGPVNGVEKVTLHSLEIPLGISYRLIKNYSSSWHLAATVKPALVLSSTNRFTGSSVYDGTLGTVDGIPSNFRFLELQASDFMDDDDLAAYRLGEASIDRSPELKTGLGLWFQLSPTYYGEITNDDPSLGFQVSLDLGFNVLSPFEAEPYRAGNGEAPAFGFADVMPATLSNGYFEAIKLHYVGLRFGLNLHWVKSVN